MQQRFEKLTYLVGDEDILRNMPALPALPLFSEKAQDFLAALSRNLLTDAGIRAFPDLSDYAFWVRGASLQRMCKRYPQRHRKLGRGLSFHIAPSNVPMAFALSFSAALLAGNACIVRLSDTEYPQVDRLIAAIRQVLEQGFEEIRPYLCIVRYPHDEAVTAALSGICDVRLIWGGNHTIAAIRRAPLPPRAVELSFADRYSIAVIDADAYLQTDAQKTAEAFYLDTYYIDQNACSSPRLVFWLGQEKERARERFWAALAERAEKEYALQPIQAIDKHTAFCMAAARGGTCLESGDNLLVRVRVDSLRPDIMENKEGGGFFFEYLADDIGELAPMLEKPCQTLSCLGVEPEQLRRMVLDRGCRGVDRIVPLGETNKLTLLWDGVDLCEAMSRYVNIGTEE